MTTTEAKPITNRQISILRRLEYASGVGPADEQIAGEMQALYERDLLTRTARTFTAADLSSHQVWFYRLSPKGAAVLANVGKARAEQRELFVGGAF